MHLTKIAINVQIGVPANGVPKNLAHSAANVVPNFCHGISCGGVREQMACQTFVMELAVVEYAGAADGEQMSCQTFVMGLARTIFYDVLINFLGALRRNFNFLNGEPNFLPAIAFKSLAPQVFKTGLKRPAIAGKKLAPPYQKIKVSSPSRLKN